MTAPDRDALHAALLLNATATQITLARQHLTKELHHHDGLPATTTGSDSNTRGERTIRVLITNPDGEPIPGPNGERQYDNVPVTTVEAAAIQRQHLTNMRLDLDALVRGALTTANQIAATCQQILGTRTETPRCTATGRDGAIEWADPTCTAVPSRGPLCDRCSKAEYRWRKAHGLPSRTDGLFTGDPAA